MRLTQASGPYWRLFARGPERMLLLIGTAGKFPPAALSLGLVLAVNGAHSRGWSGLSVAALALGLAVSSPLRGRAVDTWGTRRVFPALGIMQASLLIVLWLWLDESAIGVLILAVLVGVTTPPVVAVLRTLWLTRSLPEDERHAAQSWESVSIDIAYVLAPAMVAAVAGWATPPAVLLVVAGLVASTSVALGAVTAAELDRRSRPRGHKVALPTSVWLVVACAGASTAAVVSAELGAVGMATDLGSPAWSGLLIAVLSLGSIAGGLGYGHTNPRGTHRSHMSLAATVWASGCGLVAFDVGFAFTALGFFVAGSGFAVMVTAQYTLAGARAPDARATEVFTWMATSSQIGAAIGATSAGQLHGPSAMLLSAVFMLLAAASAAMPVHTKRNPTRSAR